MRKAITVVLGGMMLLALAAAPVAADGHDPYPPAAPACSVAPGTVVQGGTTTVTWVGGAPNTEVTATLFSHSVVLGSVTTDEDGSVTAEATIPSDTKPGAHTIQLTGLDAAGNPSECNLAITVVAADVAGVTPSPRLPRTGGDALLALGAAAGLLAMGGAALGVARRRSRAELSA